MEVVSPGASASACKERQELSSAGGTRPIPLLEPRCKPGCHRSARTLMRNSHIFCYKRLAVMGVTLALFSGAVACSVPICGEAFCTAWILCLGIVRSGKSSKSPLWTTGQAHLHGHGPREHSGRNWRRGSAPAPQARVGGNSPPAGPAGRPGKLGTPSVECPTWAFLQRFCFWPVWRLVWRLPPPATSWRCCSAGCEL